jgi:hypothetical protein
MTPQCRDVQEDMERFARPMNPWQISLLSQISFARHSLRWEQRVTVVCHVNMTPDEAGQRDAIRHDQAHVLELQSGIGCFARISCSAQRRSAAKTPERKGLALGGAAWLWSTCQCSRTGRACVTRDQAHATPDFALFAPWAIEFGWSRPRGDVGFCGGESLG